MLNDAGKLALDGAQAIVGRYGDLVSAAHRQWAVQLWRGTLPLHGGNEESSAVEIAQRSIDSTFAHAVALAEIVTKLQLESLAIFRRGALDSLKLFEP
jgi:hypothetical protein